MSIKTRKSKRTKFGTFLILNLDQETYLDPHDFGCSEQFEAAMHSDCGVGAGLMAMLRGPWANDRVVIVEEDNDEEGWMEAAATGWINDSIAALEIMAQDREVRRRLQTRLQWRLPLWPPQQAKKVRDVLGLP